MIHPLTLGGAHFNILFEGLHPRERVDTLIYKKLCTPNISRKSIRNNLSSGILINYYLKPRFFFVFYSGFDMGELSEDCPDDLEGLDSSAAHVANLLSTEPADSKI